MLAARSSFIASKCDDKFLYHFSALVDYLKARSFVKETQVYDRTLERASELAQSLRDKIFSVRRTNPLESGKLSST
ncbi:uncharacterized protein Gasu_32570 [Galdieria sulphuraria]|uniref:Uncharacterized protein n=1 Tax=Galdieria sulphuraria TaxID=130081 RepID=M2WYV7_GALSU|nr:uncharacterized protein Gasu_32570 [Galdieria sulphuraria]EME29245.1 hypothetical protein Gasu_32570 [Galdieria sulphuraria]|eukprot:XP_005705765.1 hypothetical protein Gasu_32570 [Galdieria sulphuraria]